MAITNPRVRGIAVSGALRSPGGGALFLLTGFLSADGLSPGFVMLNRYSAAFVVPNDVLLLTCLLPFAAYVLAHDPRAVAKLLAAAAARLTTAAVVLAASRAGLLALLCIAAVKEGWAFHPRGRSDDSVDSRGGAGGS